MEDILGCQTNAAVHVEAAVRAVEAEIPVEPILKIRALNRIEK